MQPEVRSAPRFIIAALRGGSGKTIISIGIIAALRQQGHRLTPFKKGPDYIDAGWLALAAGQPCFNLDTFLVPTPEVIQSFQQRSAADAIAVIEGNRGLYDGIDSKGTTSTAELSKLLKTPVVISVDCTKSTRTMAAALLGCLHFDPEVDIQGIILNRVAGSRHENILRSSIEHHCGLKVVGAVPKLKAGSFPERHMGLVPTHEHSWAKEAVEAAREMAHKYLDLETLVAIANTAAGTVLAAPGNVTPALEHPPVSASPAPRIGILQDAAFQFYYPENIEALEAQGAQTVFISPLATDRMPPIEALYIGGGFPETHVQQLADNVRFRDQLKALADEGLPIYAECGGLMYLGKALVMADRAYPMAGVLPVIFGFSKKPRGHGYTIVSVVGENPFFEVGAELRGHEFHYSYALECDSREPQTVFEMKRGTGIRCQRDGMCYNNVLATYTHIHALGSPQWAKAMVRNALAYRSAQKQKQTSA